MSSLWMVVAVDLVVKELKVGGGHAETGMRELSTNTGSTATRGDRQANANGWGDNARQAHEG
eukprot:6467469-Amphidinium_carterae.2